MQRRARRSAQPLDVMLKRPLDAASTQTYLESLPEAEVAMIFEAVALKVKRRWELRLGILVGVVWCMACIWTASGFGSIAAIGGGLVAMAIAAGAMWPFIGWLNNRVLRDEVALRAPPMTSNKSFERTREG
jgi:hypothetical protein